MKELSAMSDYELVALYENGNDYAFDVLLERHQSSVFTYIMSVVNDNDFANDIFQDAFQRAIIAIRSHKYQTTGKFSSWVTRIAHNVIVDRSREAEALYSVREGQVKPRALHAQSLCEATREDEIIAQQYNDYIRHLLDYLPDVQRDVILLRFYEGLSFKEIAQQTGVSINTALGRMRYALINLKKIFGEHRLSLVG